MFLFAYRFICTHKFRMNLLGSQIGIFINKLFIRDINLDKQAIECNNIIG
jgi:hypothetical protein